MNNPFNKDNKAKALNLLAKGIQSTTGTIHLGLLLGIHATEYIEKKAVTKILSDQGIQESDIVNDRRKASLQSEKDIKAFNAMVIAKAKEFSKATHHTTMTLVHEINPANQSA